MALCPLEDHDVNIAGGTALDDIVRPPPSGTTTARWLRLFPHTAASHMEDVVVHRGQKAYGPGNATVVVAMQHCCVLSIGSMVI